jgi:hypothetical protein
MNAMNDVMYCANECPDTRLRSHIKTPHSLGMIEISLPVIFRLHRLFFGVSSASL